MRSSSVGWPTDSWIWRATCEPSRTTDVVPVGQAGALRSASASSATCGADSTRARSRTSSKPAHACWPPWPPGYDRCWASRSSAGDVAALDLGGSLTDVHREAGGRGGVVPLELRGGGKSPGPVDEDPDADTGGRGLFSSLQHAVADGHLLGVHLLDAHVRIGGPGIQGGLQRLFRNVSHRPGW